MWISVALIVAVIIVGIIAGKRLSTPGPQRRAVYFAFGTLAVLALWFFIFVAFFPAEWIVPFFTVACIIIPICVYMMVLRSGGKERAKVPSKRSFEIPKKDITVESAKAASTVSSGTASASSATTPSKAATPAPSAFSTDCACFSTPTSQRKQILLLLLPLKQRRLLLLLLLLRQLNQLPQKLQKQLRSLLQKRRSLRNLPQRPKLHLRRNQQRNPRPLLRLHRRSLLNPQNLPSLKKPSPRSPQSKRPSRFSRSCKQAFCEQGARGRERHRRGNEENARTSC